MGRMSGQASGRTIRQSHTDEQIRLRDLGTVNGPYRMV